MLKSTTITDNSPLRCGDSTSLPALLQGVHRAGPRAAGHGVPHVRSID